MIKTLIPVLALSMCGAGAGADTPRLPYKFLACHGAPLTIAEDPFYTQAEIDQGAYTVWCYDGSGKAVAKMHHGPIWEAYGAYLAGGEGTIYVSYVHYDDAGNVDGTIDTTFKANAITMARSVEVPGGAVIALEAAGDLIGPKTGWFATTRQLINRNNVMLQYLGAPGAMPTGVHITFANWSSFSFLQRVAPSPPSG